MKFKEGDIKIIDIETNGFLSDMIDYSSLPYKLKPTARLWCVSVRDGVTDKVVTKSNKEITKEWLQNELKGCKYLVAHNGIKFDFVALRLFGLLDYRIAYSKDESDFVFNAECKIVDTLVLSRLLNPDRKGGHSIEAFGRILKNKKTPFREVCIKKGYIKKSDPQGAEFRQYVPEMVEYCEQDTSVNKGVFYLLLKELKKLGGKWDRAIKVENKLADISIKRENLGFHFDKELAIWCFKDLTSKIEELERKIQPFLGQREMNKGETSFYTPPKNQINKHGNPSTFMMNFAEKVGGKIEMEFGGKNYLIFEGKKLTLPITEPIKTTLQATIKDGDYIKQLLIDKYGWRPSEWNFRDLTINSSKIKMSLEDRRKAFKRWLEETMRGVYKKSRLELTFKSYKVNNINALIKEIDKQLNNDYPVRVPTTPPIRVGVVKELCPNLVKLGDKVEFAKYFAEYQTLAHRRSNIAGGDGVEDLDLNTERPESGYLALYRETDGRIATPAIEIGASTNRYTHKNVVNIPRVTSLYGNYMRRMFGSGEDFVQIGFDFSSLENRIQGHYILDYEGGVEEAKSLVADKPFDSHTLRAKALGISREDTKSVTYAITYGSSWAKIGDMLGYTANKAKKFYNDFWKTAPALSALKNKVEEFWSKKAKEKFLPSIDGRLIWTRSKHSLLNALFQSSGVIFAKYTIVELFRILEEKRLCVDPFEGKPDVCSMIEMHDEAQLAVNPKLIKTKTFKSKEEAEEFVKNWKGDYSLSSIKKGKDKYFVGLPNVVSKSIADAIKNTEEELKVKVEMGFDWDLGRTWEDCH